MDHLFPSIRDTDKPGAIRSNSGILFALERRISSCLITKTAAAVSCSICGLREIVEILTFINSSSEASARSRLIGVFCAENAVLINGANSKVSNQHRYVLLEHWVSRCVVMTSIIQRFYCIIGKL